MTVVTPSWVVRERVACPFTAQMPRNSATELSTTSFFLFILAHKGDIIGVNVQLEQSKHFHFHLNYENGKEKRGPLTTFDSLIPNNQETMKNQPETIKNHEN